VPEPEARQFELGELKTPELLLAKAGQGVGAVT
jgi:hypothetical protein